MRGNAENGAGSVEDYDDEHGDELDAEDSGEYADPEAYHEESASFEEEPTFYDEEDAAGASPDVFLRTGPSGPRAARKGAQGERGRAGRSQGGTGTRRVRGEDGKLPPRSSRLRTAREPEEPP